MLRAFGTSDRGQVRSTNEDCYGIDEQLRLCVVADGMGGHNAGEVAARMAVDAVTDYVRSFGALPAPDSGAWPFGFDPTLSPGGNLLRTAIQLANLQILEAAGASDECAGMGTTIVAAIERDGVLSVAHVGDSRLYLFNGGVLRQLTSDDSWIASMIAIEPETDPHIFRNHPMRNALVSVVGTRPATEVHVIEESLLGGEIAVLTTDGVHGALDASRMKWLLQNTSNVSDLPWQLTDAALRAGSRDNCTAVVAQYSPQM
jgi:protein phosphatase